MSEIDENDKNPYHYFFIKEKEMDLFSLEYNDVCYWQLVRFPLLKKITIKNLQVAGKDTKRNYKKELAGVVKEAKRMCKAIDKIPKVDIIRIRPCVSLSQDGKLDDHQYDYVKLKETYCDLYALGNYGDVPSCVEYDLACAESRLVLWKIKRKILGTKKISDEQVDKLKKFLQDINVYYAMKFDVKELLYQITYAVQCHRYYVKEYRNIFSQAEPKLIMVYPHYDEHMFAAIDAARQMGIKSVEFQHARISGHEGYWYEDQAPRGKILPDCFFTYGEWWNKQIKLPRFVNIKAVGNPYLENETTKYAPVESNTIAFFSNSHSGKVLVELLRENYEYFIENNMNIIFKLHPNEFNLWETEYPFLKNKKGVSVIKNEESVYKIISKSKYIIGVNSTVFFEALAYKNKKIIIYMNGNYFQMDALLKNNIAIGIQNSIELRNCIQDQFQSHISSNTNYEFWKQNAQDNITKEIENIL